MHIGDWSPPKNVEDQCASTMYIKSHILIFQALSLKSVTEKL